MINKYQKFHVGINVIVVKNNQLLLGKRKNVYGAGTWGMSGGHLEDMEGMKDAAARELFEETGIKAEEYIFSDIVNDRRDNHYLQIGFVAKNHKGEPQVREPDRCEERKWFDLDDLPENIFPGHVENIRLYLENSNFGDN